MHDSNKINSDWKQQSRRLMQEYLRDQEQIDSKVAKERTKLTAKKHHMRFKHNQTAVNSPKNSMVNMWTGGDPSYKQ